jgi:hypothetical protein
MGTPRSAASGFLSSEVGSIFSQHASISWQAIVFTSLSGSISPTISWLASNLFVLPGGHLFLPCFHTCPSVSLQSGQQLLVASLRPLISVVHLCLVSIVSGVHFFLVDFYFFSHGQQEFHHSLRLHFSVLLVVSVFQVQSGVCVLKFDPTSDTSCHALGMSHDK